MQSPQPSSALRLGIMQPYLFPYYGYFQLLAAVDKFVFYDDVSYIKQGWINRNRILLGGAPHLFTVPLKGASSFAAIDETLIDETRYAAWAEKFLKTLSQAYRAAPGAKSTLALVAEVLQRPYGTVSELAKESVLAVSRLLGLNPQIVPSSRVYENGELHGPERVLAICRREGATTYLNAIGGRVLYADGPFREAGVELGFICPRPVSYPQLGGEFVPSLSIIDVLMFNPPETVRGFLAEFDVEPAERA